MKKVVIVLLLTFVSGLGFTQPTYFNMRYRQAHALGSVINSMCIKNNDVFFNVHRLNDTSNLYEQIFSKVSVIDGTKTTLFELKNDSLDQFGSEIINSNTGGFIDVIDMGHLGVGGSYWKSKLIKYKTNGDTLYTKMIPDSALFQAVTGICEKVDYSLTMIGIVQLQLRAQGGSEDILLLQTDSLGNELWRKTIGDSIHYERGYCIQSTADGGYIIGGIKQKDGFTSWDEQRPWLIKTDSIGNIEWDKYYGPKDTLNLPIYDVTPTQDGGYVFVGGIGVEQFVYDAHFLPWIVKVNGVGDTLWTRTIYGSGASLIFVEYTSILELADGSLVACGHHRIPNPDTITYVGKQRTTGVITKYSAQGELLWSRDYSHPENRLSQSSEHILSSIVATPDGGFAAAGYLIPAFPDTGLQDAWIIKVDSFGCLERGCQLTSVPRIESTIAQLKIYPNPGSEIIHFDITPNLLLGNQPHFELKLYDMVGRLVLTQTLHPYENTISVGHLKSGVYNYRLNETWGSLVIE